MGDEQDTSNKQQDADCDDTAENDNGDGGDSDVIEVAQTPTNPALLTQLGHNRADSEARAYGAGHTGSAIFHMQRLTALALIPLSIWFVVGIIRMTTSTRAQAADWLSGPIQAVLMALFIAIGLRHAVIGIRIILEDYVRGEPWFTACVLVSQAIAVLLGTASIAALIHLAL